MLRWTLVVVIFSSLLGGCIGIGWDGGGRGYRGGGGHHHHDWR